MPFELALPLEWLVDDDPLRVFAKCLFICPIMPMILALLLESRWLPLGSRYQFFAFFPGNPFLAGYIALASTLRSESSTSGWWQTTTGQQSMLFGAFVVYVVLNIMDLTSNYTKQQMAAPTKIYHNALYFWYGYLAAAMTLVVVSAEVSPAEKYLRMIPGFFWLICFIADAMTSEKKLAIKFQTAHTGWNPLWVTQRFLRLRYNRSLHSYVYS